MIVICALAKNEEDYINEWVKFHLNIGFDKIYIYDNGEQKTHQISDYVDTTYLDRVEIIDVKGRKERHLTSKIYDDFYRNYGTTFDWCLFINIDDFVFGTNDIKEVCSRAYTYTPQIRIKLKIFGDDDLIERDMSKPVYEVFKKRIIDTKKRDLSGKAELENFGKCMVRGGLRKVKFFTPYYASYGDKEEVLPSCAPNGNLLNYSKTKLSYRNYDLEQKVFIHSYMTKSLSEFVKQRLGKRQVDKNDNYTIDDYLTINKMNKEKENYVNMIKEKQNG